LLLNNKFIFDSLREVNQLLYTTITAIQVK
jgi:hypothetical protein